MLQNLTRLGDLLRQGGVRAATLVYAHKNRIIFRNIEHYYCLMIAPLLTYTHILESLEYVITLV